MHCTAGIMNSSIALYLTLILMCHCAGGGSWSRCHLDLPISVGMLGQMDTSIIQMLHGKAPFQQVIQFDKVQPRLK